MLIDTRSSLHAFFAWPTGSLLLLPIHANGRQIRAFPCFGLPLVALAGWLHNLDPMGVATWQDSSCIPHMLAGRETSLTQRLMKRFGVFSIPQVAQSTGCTARQGGYPCDYPDQERWTLSRSRRSPGTLCARRNVLQLIRLCRFLQTSQRRRRSPTRHHLRKALDLPNGLVHPFPSLPRLGYSPLTGWNTVLPHQLSPLCWSWRRTHRSWSLLLFAYTVSGERHHPQTPTS
jgi:hypothetical protein